MLYIHQNNAMVSIEVLIWNYYKKQDFFGTSFNFERKKNISQFLEYLHIYSFKDTDFMCPVKVLQLIQPCNTFNSKG